jgi:membrane dipeptidase
MYATGARYRPLAALSNTDWADWRPTPPHTTALRPSAEGVHEMNRLGMLVDISHVSAETMHAVLDTARKPR